MTKKVAPRQVPDRDSKYMALAWFYAGFSKDPYTQVGAVIIDQYNRPLGHGYNGPPRLVPDDEINWARPLAGHTEVYDKYDIIVHAEINAIDHSCGELTGSTLYVTGLPCPACMLAIARREIDHVVYMDYKSDPNSSLQNPAWREKSLKIASLSQVKVREFTGKIGWMADWILRLREKGVL